MKLLLQILLLFIFTTNCFALSPSSALKKSNSNSSDDQSFQSIVYVPIPMYGKKRRNPKSSFIKSPILSRHTPIVNDDGEICSIRRFTPDLFKKNSDCTPISQSRNSSRYSSSPVIYEEKLKDIENDDYYILSDELKDICRIYIIDGLCYNYKRELFNSSSEGTRFIMEENGNIYALPKELHKLNSIMNHASFNGYSPISAGGYIVIRDGKILKMKKFSGHYRQDLGFFMQFIIELYKNNININDIELSIFGVPIETKIKDNILCIPIVQLYNFHIEKLQKFQELNILLNEKIMKSA